LRLNCAAVPANLVESELFGYERGAFTGANARKVGFLEAANGGSLLLDEIGELPAEAQAKLLRVLEARSIVRVGGTREVPIDVRLIYATHRDLEADVRAGRFREDLFFRICTFTLHVPPLRERPNDIIALGTLFAEQASARLGVSPAEVTPRALAQLLGYRWPGNVRELRNALEHAVVLANGAPIGLEHLPDRLRGHAGTEAGAGSVLKGELSDVERRRVEQALRAEGGNQTRAALRLGISRRGLIRKLDKYGLKPR
jgi:transcriptional regulator with PAS, ATPase and Fis domain